MSFTSDPPQVHSLDEAPLTGYRGVSLLAILTLVLGAGSALALVHPFLWIVPAVTVVCAFFALCAIAAEGSNVTGRSLALAGLALALVFGLWAPTRILSRQFHLQRQARAFAGEWLELLAEGKLHDAHQLTERAIERQKPTVSLANYYEGADAKTRFDRFFAEKPAKTLKPLAGQVTFTFRSNDGVRAGEYGREHVALSYVAHYEENGKARELPVRIVLERETGVESHEHYWRVTGVLDPLRVEE